MRKIKVGAFVSLDGIMQAPGGSKEDPSGGFALGGWVAGLWDDVLGASITDMMAPPFDLLLGRRTYDIFAAHWPHVASDPAASGFDALNASIADRFNRLTKYVATHRPETLSWANSQALGSDAIAALRALKREDGPALLTQGSTDLLAQLFANDLVDELHLMVFPIVLGKGKRLFGGGSMPAGYRLVSSRVSTKGVLIAGYERAGQVATGSFERDQTDTVPGPAAASI
jgi:dihydrofolate reductase